jgi:sugar phosphate isomerase/epimerase
MVMLHRVKSAAPSRDRRKGAMRLSQSAASGSGRQRRTTMPDSLPTLGAAVRIETLERLRNWIFDRERDVEIQDFADVGALDGDWRPLAERYARLLDGHRGRVGIHGPFWGLDIANRDPEIGAIVARRYMQGLDACAAVGATLMVIHSPFTTWDYNNLDAYPRGREELLARVRRNIGAVIDRAADQGIILAVENIEDKNPADRVWLARELGGAVRVSLDTGHAQYAHGSTGAPPVDHYVQAAGEMLAHVHVQDADGYGDRHWAPGEGTIRWPAVFRALARIETRPRLILELADHGQIVAGAEHLAGLGVAG